MSGSQPGGGADPSMEDILASIRRILSEDDAPPAPASREAADRGSDDRGSADRGSADRGSAERAAAPGVFTLEASMMVPEPPPPTRVEPKLTPTAPAIRAAIPANPVMSEPSPPELTAADPQGRKPEVQMSDAEMPPPPKLVADASPPPPPPMAPPLLMPTPPAESPRPEPVPPSWPTSLVAPEAAAAAALSVGSLRRTLEAGRNSLAVRTGGPTLEDMVREELRPVLKAWLDANLAPMVERLVRAEIERVVGRSDI